MIIGWCFIWIFAVLINKVCLQVTVVGFIGGSVVLPCCSTAHNFKLQDINVLWRDKHSESICNVVKGEDSVERQGLRYKNRTETFPEDYLRGNFSIKLKNLTHTDAGEFSCFITHSYELRTVQLIINETAGKRNQSSEQENQGPETQSNWTILICVFTVLIVIIVVAGIMAGFMCLREKKVFS